MNKHIIITFLLLATLSATAQKVNPEVRKNTVVKQYITSSKGTSTPVLDNVATYDELGRKIEEIEYASYGQKERQVFEYKGESPLCSRIIVYNDKNAVAKIKKIEYNADGTRKVVYTYSPKGKLNQTKTYEYSTR